MTAEIEPRRLAQLADEIRTEVDAAEADYQSAVHHAIRAGDLLIEAKGQVKHGGWLPWLESNFEFTDRTARRYMQIAENRTRVSELGSVREALKLIAAPKPQGAASLRHVQHEEVEADLRRMVVRGEWRHEEGFDAWIAWCTCGTMLSSLDKAGAPADFGYADLDEYVAERLPDVQNAWRSLEFEMAANVESAEYKAKNLKPVLTETSAEIAHETGRVAWRLLTNDQRREVVERAAADASKRGDRIDAARLYIELAESFSGPAPWEEEN